MDLKMMKRQLERLSEIVGGWDGNISINALERDMALEMLRDIYTELRFGDQKAGPETEPAATDAEKAEAPAACAPVQPEPEEVGSEPEPVTEPEPFVESEPEPVTEPEPFVESEPEPVTEPEPVIEPERPVMPRRVVDPGVIRTLYGSEPITPKATEKETPAPQPVQEVQPEPEPMPEPEPEPMPEPEPESMPEPEPQPVMEQPAPEPEPQPATERPGPQPEAAKTTTLGDVMNEGRQTLGESLGNGRKDMASKIAAAGASSLRASIGLNDKFLMVRDMFEGDTIAYDEAITTLDGFTDLDEAIIYIHDTYDWSADSDGVKLLVDLLERKLG